MSAASILSMLSRSRNSSGWLMIVPAYFSSMGEVLSESGGGRKLCAPAVPHPSKFTQTVNSSFAGG
jgi:hypothetical protein